MQFESGEWNWRPNWICATNEDASATTSVGVRGRANADDGSVCRISFALVRMARTVKRLMRVFQSGGADVGWTRRGEAFK